MRAAEAASLTPTRPASSCTARVRLMMLLRRAVGRSVEQSRWRPAKRSASRPDSWADGWASWAGRPAGPTAGRQNGRMVGRSAGRADGRSGGRLGRWAGGKATGRSVRRSGGRRADGRTHGRMDDCWGAKNMSQESGDEFGNNLLSKTQCLEMTHQAAALDEHRSHRHAETRRTSRCRSPASSAPKS